MNSHPQFRRASFALLAFVCISLSASLKADGFTVIKNVNSGKAPEESVVLFDSSKPSDHLVLESSDNAKWTRLDDGTLECVISGFAAITPTIRWKAGAGIPETFDAGAHTYLVLKCRLEGSAKETMTDGKILERRGDNLWFGPSLINAQGERVGHANLADVAEDTKTPSVSTTLYIPMILFTANRSVDASKIQGIMFPWPSTRSNTNREFRLVIEKIALAN